MAAGESARAEAARVRKKINDLERYADTFERGAVGEERTAEALDALGPDWVVFHDLRWPGRRLANIDHVVVGAGGVFVIDSKNWSGDVLVNNGVLRQNGYNREKSVAGVGDAALALADLLGPHAMHVHPVLCFVQQQALWSRAHEVLICSTDNVAEVLRSFDPLWTPEQVVEAATRLDGQVISATQAGRGYAPGPRLWPDRPRPLTSRPPARAGASPDRPPKTAVRQVSPRRRAAAIVTAVVLSVVLGLPLLLLGGGLVAHVVVGIASSDNECKEATAAAEEPQRRTRERPARRDAAPAEKQAAPEPVAHDPALPPSC